MLSECEESQCFEQDPSQVQVDTRGERLREFKCFFLHHIYQSCKVGDFSL